jgi:hypothetical protein
VGLVRSSLAPLPPYRLWDADPTIQVIVVVAWDETTGVYAGWWIGGAFHVQVGSARVVPDCVTGKPDVSDEVWAYWLGLCS